MNERKEFDRWKERQEKRRVEIRNQILWENCLGPYSRLDYSARELINYVAKLWLEEIENSGKWNLSSVKEEKVTLFVIFDTK